MWTWPKRKYIKGIGWRKRVLYFVLELVGYTDGTEISFPWRLLYYALFPIEAFIRDRQYRRRVNACRERAWCKDCMRVATAKCCWCSHDPESTSVTSQFSFKHKGRARR
jgi:hypothetical protein